MILREDAGSWRKTRNVIPKESRRYFTKCVLYANRHFASSAWDSVLRHGFARNETAVGPGGPSLLAVGRAVGHFRVSLRR